MVVAVTTVTNMWTTFISCTNLTTAPTIPGSVTNMGSTFYSCSALTGNIYIYSTEITDASSCFNNTSLTKNIYIHYKHQNGMYTKTYNSFIAAGYKTDGSVNGVYLKPIDGTTYKLDVTNFSYTIPSQYNIALTGYTGASADVVVPALEGDIQ